MRRRLFTDFSMFHFNYFVYPVVIGYIQIPINFHIQNKQKVENVRLMTHTSLCVFFFSGLWQAMSSAMQGKCVVFFCPPKTFANKLVSRQGARHLFAYGNRFYATHIIKIVCLCNIYPDNTEIIKPPDFSNHLNCMLMPLLHKSVILILKHTVSGKISWNDYDIIRATYSAENARIVLLCLIWMGLSMGTYYTLHTTLSIVH